MDIAYDYHVHSCEVVFLTKFRGLPVYDVLESTKK